MEEWCKIPEFDNYKISTDGRIWSLNSNKLLKLKKNNNDGYLRIILCKNGTTKTFLVHRLVATTFIENPLGKRTVNHKNEIKTDNRVKNLEWATDKENTNYGTGSERRAQKERKPVLQFDLDGNLINRFEGVRIAGTALNMCFGRIADAAKSGNGLYKGFLWEYECG